ncbi:postreplication repair E3 ubiquitin-protein ligase RAD18-like [Iris pallida]|uniref:E3 ubiquitin-protein ligase RMA n=1 Tax=Iris pallida TaxID=29817 RepID=A0AAX6F1R8_IRIPA|nr:postreplication repair E3 ubiquitin-protein ligase RAD18-like [Iris pallida]
MRKRKASSAKVEILKEKSEGAPDFECNVCLELAKEPVVTCCGHLFCWPCLYQWLHVHCSYQECPVCKGKVNESSIVPVYGRGTLEATVKKESEENGDPRLEVPPRPQGNRVESLRQHLQSRSLRGPATSLERLRVLFEDNNQGVQFVPVEGRNPWVLTRHSSPNSQISASSSLHQDGAASQQRAAIDGSISRFSAFLAEIRSMSRRSVEAVGIASADNQHDFGPVVSQTSNSSTVAMILGNNAAIDASTEPSRGGSSMLLRGRVRRRSTAGVSQGSNAADGSSDGPNRRGSSMVLRRRVGRNSTAAMQGDSSAETNASSVEPNRGGFTMVLRRGRGRSSDSSSMDHVGRRRRLD